MNKTSNDNPLNYNHLEMKQKIGVSGCKIFDREDLTYENRKRLQHLQQKYWKKQQIKEKEERKQLNKELNMAYEQQTLHINIMVIQLEKTEQEKRNDKEKARKTLNMEQTYEGFDKDRYQEQINQADKQQHIQYFTTNNFQTENTQTCQSILAQHRVIPYHWKVMNEQQRKQILLKQDQQKAENDMIRQTKQEEEKLYALQIEQQRNQQINLDRERENRLRDIIQATTQFNLQASVVQKLKFKTAYGKQ